MLNAAYLGVRPLKKALSIDYRNLAPTIMDVPAAFGYLEELLALADTGEYDEKEICEGLHELIQVRLSDNLASPDPVQAARVFSWLVENQPHGDIEHFDIWLTVLVNVSADTPVEEYLERKLAGSISAKERELVHDALSEIRA